MTNYSALHHAEVSKRAAEGTDAQAQSIGLEHSAKTYALQAAASAATASPPPLFKYDWYEYLIDDERYLRCDTFSWHPGGTYSNCYDHLVDDIDGVSPSTETVGGYTVTYYQATDGHKICLPDQESTILNIYNATGVAWYYILDTANTRFKLPRTKYGFVGLRDTVGKYVEAGLPNITGSFYMGKSGNTANDYGISGAFKSVTAAGQGNSSAASGNTYQFNFDASSSNPIYGNSSTVQPPATQMYLYCYVGQFSQSATEQTAGLNSELFNGKMDLDGGNVVASAGPNFRNISNWSSNTSNCITNIPQNIKLELNNGTLTLKAGSKVYVPNGFEQDGTTPKFDVVTLTSDTTQSSFGSDTHRFLVCVDVDSQNISCNELSNAVSGTTPPSTGFFYNTSTNQLLFYSSGSTNSKIKSFPVCIFQMTSGVITSITQIFNGFGYFGSTVFALPGVKGLIPNGRNADGTLKSVEIEVNSVTTKTLPGNNWAYCWINRNAEIDFDRFFYVSDKQPTTNTAYGHWLNTQENKFYRYYNNGWYYENTGCVIVAQLTVESSSPYKITSFTPKTVFHAVDYNDKGTIVGWGMPNYSAGVSVANNTEYTATENCFITQQSIGSVASSIWINGIEFRNNTNNTSTAVGWFIPKGTTYKTSANGTFTKYPLKGG